VSVVANLPITAVEGHYPSRRPPRPPDGAAGARGEGADQGLRRGGERRKRVRGTPADTGLPASTVATPGGGRRGLGTVVTRLLDSRHQRQGSGSGLGNPSRGAIRSDNDIYQILCGLASSGRAAAAKHGPSA